MSAKQETPKIEEVDTEETPNTNQIDTEEKPKFEMADLSWFKKQLDNTQKINSFPYLCPGSRFFKKKAIKVCPFAKNH